MKTHLREILAISAQANEKVGFREMQRESRRYALSFSAKGMSRHVSKWNPMRGTLSEPPSESLKGSQKRGLGANRGISRGRLRGCSGAIIDFHFDHDVDVIHHSLRSVLSSLFLMSHSRWRPLQQESVLCSLVALAKPAVMSSPTSNRVVIRS